MEDYPRNLVEFDEHFASEEACIAYLMSLRWPKGFACPKCDGDRAWRRTRLAMVCARCRHETSITAGTLFEKTHKPLRVWFKALWSVTSQKTGTSALGLQRVLGLGSYETAWLWLHKLHRAVQGQEQRGQATQNMPRPELRFPGWRRFDRFGQDFAGFVFLPEPQGQHPERSFRLAQMRPSHQRLPVVFLGIIEEAAVQ